MEDNKIDYWCLKLSTLAEQALLTEAVLTPKPGLVDAHDAGSHKDMDIHTFIQSATAFKEPFSELVKLGLTYNGALSELLPHIRKIGIEAEKRMFNETKGINTHKGVVFSLGILLTSYGLYLQRNPHVNNFTAGDTVAVIEIVKEITDGLVSRELSNLHKKAFLTHGEKLYQKYGITGVRGEVEQGFPSVMVEVLPYLRKTVGMDLNKRLLDSLFLLMATTEDSNIIHRSNIETLQDVKRRSKAFIQAGGMSQREAIEQVKEMNQDFMALNISPGGSADLLSVAILISKVEKIID
ncbi:triphosphoribosyl-dephospho-CoA synthase CitG [Jeotgalibaca sp. A122]|uniref:triphosphoribosyl-dephospho-CoA synthase CitG n=1 Tax=Jeotgalibaca sp. A122 TaxID=3457322 RepID=UPI003FD2EBF6